MAAEAMVLLHPRVRADVLALWQEGEGFFGTALRAWPVKRAFTPMIIYQLCGMAMEKFFMAWLTQEGNLPDNHTLRDLVRGADRVERLPEALRRRLLRMDRFMALCPLTPQVVPEPAAGDVSEFLELAGLVKDWCGSRVDT